jgi:hypothetical protein
VYTYTKARLISSRPDNQIIAMASSSSIEKDDPQVQNNVSGESAGNSADHHQEKEEKGVSGGRLRREIRPLLQAGHHG